MLDALFTGHALWFSAPALLGSVLLIIRIVMMSIGGHDTHVDTHIDTHVGADGSHHGHTDASQLFSIQSIIGFITGFGWGGLAALKGTTWDMIWVILTGLAFGMFIVWLQLFLLAGMRKLSASGNININRAMGLQGAVYVEIPGNNTGRGQVTLVIDDKQRILNAITPDETLPSKTRVNVVGINPDNTITVRKA